MKNIVNIKNRKSFTLIEIMTVVAVIALLAAVAMAIYYSSKKTAERNICVANMRQIQTIINNWAIDTGADDKTTFTTADLVPSYIKVWPKEGTADYPVPANIKTLPTCPNVDTKPDHKL